MKKYTIKTANSIANDAETTLQETFSFRKHLNDNLKEATALRGDFHRLSESLQGLRKANRELASKPTHEDNFESKIASLEGYNSNLERKLKEEEDVNTVLESNLRDLNSKHESIREGAEKRFVSIGKTLELYSRALGLTVQAATDGFHVTFDDYGETVLIQKTDANTIVLKSPKVNVSSNLRDPIALLRLLCNARSELG